MKHILFGLQQTGKIKPKVFFINLLIIVAKFHLHKCNFLKREPIFFFSFYFVFIELKDCMITIRPSMCQKAKTTIWASLQLGVVNDLLF